MHALQSQHYLNVALWYNMHKLIILAMYVSIRPSCHSIFPIVLTCTSLTLHTTHTFIIPINNLHHSNTSLHYYTLLSITDDNRNQHILLKKKYLHSTFCSRGKDFQSAESKGVITTAIQDMVFPVSKQGTKTNFTFKY